MLSGIKFYLRKRLQKTQSKQKIKQKTEPTKIIWKISQRTENLTEQHVVMKNFELRILF